MNNKTVTFVSLTRISEYDVYCFFKTCLGSYFTSDYNKANPHEIVFYGEYHTVLSVIKEKRALYKLEITSDNPFVTNGLIGYIAEQMEETNSPFHLDTHL